MSFRNSPLTDTTDSLYSKFRPEKMLEAMELDPKFAANIKYDYIKKYYMEFNIPTILPMQPYQDPQKLNQMLRGICYLGLALNAKTEIDLSCNKSELRNSLQEFMTLKNIYKKYLKLAANCENILAQYLLLLESVTTDLSNVSIENSFQSFEESLAKAEFLNREEKIEGPIHYFYAALIYYHFIVAMNEKMNKQPSATIKLFKETPSSKDAVKNLENYMHKVNDILTTFEPNIMFTDPETTRMIIAFNGIKPLNKSLKDVKPELKELNSLTKMIREQVSKQVVKSQKVLGLK